MDSPAVDKKSKRWLAYRQQRKNAKARGIPFLMSFEEWCYIWDYHGFFEKRGTKSYQYCMGRRNDTGPYAPLNVKIITQQQNARERKYTPEMLEKMRRVMLGRKMSEEARRRVSLATSGSGNSQFGKPRDPEVRRKISRGMSKYWDDVRSA